jgi:PAS domain S-box-containing protein
LETRISTALANRRARCDGWFVRRDGSRFWGTGTLTPLRDSAGVVFGFVKTLRDVSAEQVERDPPSAQAGAAPAEAPDGRGAGPYVPDDAELLRTRRFAERVADISPAIVYVFDYQEMRNVYVNREATTSLGYTPGQIAAMGSDVVDRLIHPDDRAGHRAQVERVKALADGETVEWEYRMRRADGEWRWFLGRDAVFARDADGARHGRSARPSTSPTASSPRLR